jgi:hypothetical protein
MISRRFAEYFRLNTEVLADHLAFLANNEAKQRKIKEKASKQVQPEGANKI